MANLVMNVTIWVTAMSGKADQSGLFWPEGQASSLKLAWVGQT